MAIIGTFMKDGAGFSGTLETIAYKAKLSFEPLTSKKNDSAPDFRVIHLTQESQSEVGAAWKKTSREGAEYLSVSIDDPGFVSRINCRLVKTGAEFAYTLYWDRPRPNDGK